MEDKFDLKSETYLTLKRIFIDLETEFEEAIASEIQELEDEITSYDEDLNPEKTIEQIEDEIEFLRELDFSIALIRKNSMMPESIHKAIDTRLNELIRENNFKGSAEELLDNLESAEFAEEN